MLLTPSIWTARNNSLSGGLAAVDELWDRILQDHSRINIVDFGFYDTNIFNRCESGSDVLLAIPGWANVHPLLFFWLFSCFIFCSQKNHKNC